MALRAQGMDRLGSPGNLRWDSGSTLISAPMFLGLADVTRDLLAWKCLPWLTPRPEVQARPAQGCLWIASRQVPLPTLSWLPACTLSPS